MWFWSGSSVKENEISDIRAYNHANGVMWIVYSLVLWAASLAGFWNGTAALTLIILIKNIEYEEKYKRQYHGNYVYTVGDWSAYECLPVNCIGS